MVCFPELGSMKKKNRGLAKVIQKKSKEVIRASREPIKKTKHTVEKDKESLVSRAKKYDELVHSLLMPKENLNNKLLMFNYKYGFILDEANQFTNYSIKL